MPKIVTIGSVGTTSHMRKIYRYPRNACYTGRTVGLILTLDGTFDENFANKVLLGVGN
jgi:hypothetical protein